MKPEHYTWDYTNVTDECLKQLIASASAELENRREKKASAYHAQLLALIEKIEKDNCEVTFDSVSYQCFDIDVTPAEDED